jgi:hypothetical protein
MTPHRQLITHDPENGRYGDCQRTCVAAILNLHPSEVPHFCDEPGGEKWAERQAAWLAQRGLAAATVAYHGDVDFDQVMDWTSRQSPGVPMIVLGRSRIGANHVVVVLDGQIVCDPSGNGIVGPCAEGKWEVSMLCVASNWGER